VDKRKDLKKPIGKLIKGDPKETILILKIILDGHDTPLFACVGDFVSKNIIDSCLSPDIIVVDNRIMRQNVEPLLFKHESIKVENPPGTITINSQKALQDAISLNKRIGVVVEGEEDLLVLPLMAMMPTGSVIVYGQPREGMVLVILTEERRRWAKDFMTMMEEK
jgi:uncharacterized protein (UPF0218 family)